MESVEKETLSSDKVTFFTELDMNNKGKPSGVFPSWYFDQVIGEKQETIRKMERALADSFVPPAQVPTYRETLKKEKESLEKLLSAKPNIKKHTDKIASIVGKNDKDFGSLGDKIGESMFTRDQMMKGLADAHKEAERMATPCIRLSPEEASMAKAAHLNLAQGNKVSRNDAEVLWKIGRKAIGESTNTEILRR